MLRFVALAAIPLCLALVSCSQKPQMTSPKDTHSYADPRQYRVRHLDLDLEVLFHRKVLRGSATLTVDRLDAGSETPLVLDTRDLKIEKVEAAPAGNNAAFQPATFEAGKADPILGSPLRINLPEDASRVRIFYETSPGATALQWLDPAQTADRKHPFLYTQSEAIHARSWIPLQDTPGVRFTYRAHVRTPKDLVAVMSARMDFRLADPKEIPNGDYNFRMPNAIPSYLVALAVGDIDFRQMSTRTGVWAEPSVVEKAAKEFDDTERMIQAAEQLYGRYRWLRYDLLVLPPSFPFGGMENPLLTFATPTVIAGDKSLVSLVAHELAHSWSGNLVSNATWRDFWLNEGFTVYVERRIQENVFGEAQARMEAVLGRQDLEREMAKLPPKDQILHIDLDGRDPDDGFTSVPYEKGALFLTAIEKAFGRDRFDPFLRGYFDHFAFQSITTDQFLEYLKKNLLDKDPAAAANKPVDEWINQPGIPASAPVITSDAFIPVDKQVEIWTTGKGDKAATKDWNTQQWLHFLRAFPNDLPAARMKELDKAFGFTRSHNAEILAQWLEMSVRAKYEPAWPVLEDFLTTVGRRKFLKPLYEELVKTPDGLERARKIYEKARPGYHPIAVATIDGILKGAK